MIFGSLLLNTFSLLSHCQCRRRRLYRLHRHRRRRHPRPMPSPPPSPSPVSPPIVSPPHPSRDFRFRFSGHGERPRRGVRSRTGGGQGVAPSSVRSSAPAPPCSRASLVSTVLVRTPHAVRRRARPDPMPAAGDVWNISILSASYHHPPSVLSSPLPPPFDAGPPRQNDKIYATSAIHSIKRPRHRGRPPLTHPSHPLRLPCDGRQLTATRRTAFHVRIYFAHKYVCLCVCVCVYARVHAFAHANLPSLAPWRVRVYCAWTGGGGESLSSSSSSPSGFRDD